jgi:hypothetical protein
MSTYKVFYTKGVVFGGAIGCLLTNIYIRNKYMLIPTDMKIIIDKYMPKNANVKQS